MLKESRVSDWCDIDHDTFDCVGCDAEPGTQCSGVSRRIVVLMLSQVGSDLRVDDPAERHQPEREPSDYKLPNSTGHNP